MINSGYANTLWIGAAWTALVILIMSTSLSCTSASASQEHVESGSGDSLSSLQLTLPSLSEKGEGGKLRVIATTSIIGDIVSNLGGEIIDLTILMDPGQDPHSYIPSAGDLTSVSEAQVIFVNGWDLEEGLLDTLATTNENAPIVPVSAGMTPLVSEDASAKNNQAAASIPDPHTWLDPHLVKQWVENVIAVLIVLNPENNLVYQANASAYQQQLDELIQYFDDQVGPIPADRRKIVTNHDSLGYFAAAYDFEIIGTVIPAASTLADPSSSDLAELIQKMELNGICMIFSDVATSDQLAETAVQELGSCKKVEVIQLYTGALGPVGSGAETYIDMMRENIDSIVDGLGFTSD